MAGSKETPRQKMIGMMYLVLTDLLALNVSKEIINAFVTQDDQLLETNNNLVRGINGLLGKFDVYKLNPSTKQVFEKWQPKVEKVKQLSNEVDDILLDYQNLLLEQSEGKPNWFIKEAQSQLTQWEQLHTIQNKEDYDIATRLFGGEPSTEGFKRGGEIRQKLLTLRNDLIKEMASFNERGVTYNVSKEDLISFDALENVLEKQKHPEKQKLLTIYSTLNQSEKLKNHGIEEHWQLVKFDHQPVVGAIGVFTELRNQVRIAEQKALEIIFSKLDGQIMNINKIEPQIIASTRYINIGDTIGVKVGIVAYDSTATYPIKYFIGSQEITKPTNQFRVDGNSAGNQKIEGFLSVEMSDGKKDLPWSFEYTVGKPQGTISLPEYDVLYGDGYENLIEGTASGFPPDQIKVNCEGCNSFTKRGTVYVANVNAGREVSVKVLAPGLSYSKKYKVLSLPKPEVTLNGKFERATVMEATQFSQVNLKSPSSSPLKINYQVVSFSIDVNNYSREVEGSSLNTAARNLVRGVKKGDKITVSNIKYKVPNKSTLFHLGSSIIIKVI